VTVDGRAPDEGNSAVPYSLFKETISTESPWFRHSIGSRLKPEMQHLLETYSGIPREKIIPHIEEIRDKAWRTRPYPCVGSYAFLATPMLQTPLLEALVTRLQNGEKLIDLGTCFGQELRILASAGAPTENMFALDLVSEFWTLSFELFRDRDKMKAHFIKEDFMSTVDALPAQDVGLRRLEGKVNIIHAGYFFHLFGWDDQIKALVNVVRLSQSGTTLVGHQIGRATAVEVTTPWKNGERKAFYHNNDSWSMIWEEVQKKTDTKWQVECECIELGEFGLEIEDYNWMSANARALKFVVTRL